MIHTQIEHTTRNGWSPIYDGHLTFVPPFAPGVKPDHLILLGAAPSDAIFENSTLKLTDTFGRLLKFPHRKIVEESMEVITYRAAVKRVVSHTVTADPSFKGGRIGLVIRAYEPGRYDHAPNEMSYFTVVDEGATDAQILNDIATRINADPNRYVDAAVTTGPDKITITSKFAGRYFESVAGKRLAKETQVTPNQRTVLDGPFLDAIGSDIDPINYASTKQYRGIAFQVEQFQTFAGMGSFRNGRSENNGKTVRIATVWAIADVSVAEGTTKLNIVISALNGSATPTTKYDKIGSTSGDVVAFV